MRLAKSARSDMLRLSAGACVLIASSGLVQAAAPGGQGEGWRPERIDNVAVTWSKCAPQFEGALPGECARVTVPLRRDVRAVQSPRERRPIAREIDIGAQRFTVPHAKGAIWLLDGGPGGTGWRFFDSKSGSGIPALNAAGWDVYVYNHRGMPGGDAYGTNVTCSQAIPGPVIPPPIYVPCSTELLNTWGPDGIGFNSYEAADDLAALIMHGRRERPDQRVAIYGESYGTYLAQRFLQRHPRVADLAVLDGTLPLGRKDVLTEGALASEAALMDYFKACGSIPACVNRLGTDPVATARKGFKALLDGTCKVEAASPPGGDPGIGLGGANAVLTSIMFNASELPELPLVIALRASRCNSNDQRALATLFKKWGEGSATQGVPTGFVAGTFNSIAGAAVSVADILPLNYDEAAAVAELARKNLVFLNAGDFAKLLQSWVRFPETASHRDERRFAARVPVLMVHGKLDMQTPTQNLDETTAWLKPTAALVNPMGGHVNARSPGCGLNGMIAWLNRPKKAPDASCFRSMAEVVDFAGTRPELINFAKTYFGEDSLWGQ